MPGVDTTIVSRAGDISSANLTRLRKSYRERLRTDRPCAFAIRFAVQNGRNHRVKRDAKRQRAIGLNAYEAFVSSNDKGRIGRPNRLQFSFALLARTVRHAAAPSTWPVSMISRFCPPHATCRRVSPLFSNCLPHPKAMHTVVGPFNVLPESVL